MNTEKSRASWFGRKYCKEKVEHISIAEKLLFGDFSEGKITIHERKKDCLVWISLEDKPLVTLDLNFVATSVLGKESVFNFPPDNGRKDSCEIILKRKGVMHPVALKILLRQKKEEKWLLTTMIHDVDCLDITINNKKTTIEKFVETGSQYSFFDSLPEKKLISTQKLITV